MLSETYVIKQNLSKASLWKRARPVLGRLDIELTERCNNNCIHCYINLSADDLEAEKKELKTAEIKRILKEAVSLGCLRVRFTGGEPLLREDFEELYIFSRKQGLKVIIFTNASLINAHLAEVFTRIPPLEKIEVTVYGMKKESYEAVSRVQGSFAAAWYGIELLLKKKIPFIVKGTILPYNKSEIEEFEKWAKTLPWMDKPASYSLFLDLRCRRDGYKNELIKKLRLKPEEGLKVLLRNQGYLKERREFCARFMRPGGENLFTCGAGCSSGCVDAYGNFQLCMLLRHPDTVYDLRNGSLKDALENFFPKIRELKTTNPEYISRCARCFLKGLCEQCPAKSWIEYGTLDTPVEYLCAVAQAQARFLGLLKERERAWEVGNGKERMVKWLNG